MPESFHPGHVSRPVLDGSTLTLFVLRVLLIYDVDAAFTTYNLVVGTPLFYAGANFHRSSCLYDSDAQLLKNVAADFQRE